MRRVEHEFTASQDVGDYVDKWVEISGSYTGTAKLQGQLTANGATFDVPSGSATGGTPLLVKVEAPFRTLVLNVSGATGVPVAKLAARDARSE